MAAEADSEADDDESDEQGAGRKLSFAVKMRWILALALLSWAGIIAAASFAWRLLH